eukprot:2768328-Prymnesium_polylepis.1
MVASCVICLGESGQALAGKRCRPSACKKAYAERLAALKAARTGHLATPMARGASPAPSTAGTTSTHYRFGTRLRLPLAVQTWGAARRVRPPRLRPGLALALRAAQRRER